MKIKGTNPETSEEFQADAKGVDNEFIKSMIEFKALLIKYSI
jgi:hypothetical protein